MLDNNMHKKIDVNICFMRILIDEKTLNSTTSAACYNVTSEEGVETEKASKTTWSFVIG